MKNKVIILLAILMTICILIVVQVKPAGAVAGPIRGLWHFDEGTETAVYDSSGWNNDGTVYGGAMWTDGKAGKALDFDGVDDYVEVPDSDSLDITGKITLEAWIYPHNVNADDLQVIVAKYNHSENNGAYYLGLGGYGYKNKILLGLSNDGYHYYYVLSNTNITANIWTHVAATSNGTHMVLYINRIKDSLQTYLPGVIYASTAPLRIGCYLPELGYSRFFDGIIDEVKVSATTIWTVDDDRVQCPAADFTNIQPAINAASSGDTIYVYDGIYNENLAINKALTIQAASRPVIDGGAAGDCISVSANNVIISGFEIRNGYNGIGGQTSGSTFSNNVIHDNLNIPGSAGIGILLWGDNDNNTIIGNEICSNDRQGIFIGYSDFADETHSKISTGNLIENNIIYNNGVYRYENGPDASAYGIQLWCADDNVIQKNEVYGHDDWFPYGGTFDFAQGIYLCDSNNNNIANNYLHDNNHGVGLWHPARSLANNYINHNNIAGNTGYGICNYDGIQIDARFNWWGDASGPNQTATNPSGLGDKITEYVDYSPWLGFVVGTSPMTWHVNPTGTIQEAIDEANSGDTILVHAGTYNEALYINKALTVKAASKPIIQGSQSFTTNYGTREAVIFVENAVNVVLEGLDIQGKGFSGGGIKNYVVIIEEASGRIRNCTVSPNTIGDMYSTGIAAWDSSGLAIEETTLENFGRIGVFYFNDCTGGVYNSTIIGQVYGDEDKVNYGIEVEGYTAACDIEIIRNDIYNCDNTYYPEPLWSSTGIVIDGWMAYYNPPTVYSSTVEIEKNDIHDNYYGIEVVANNLSYAYHNNIFNNSEYGVINDPDSLGNNVTFDARFNWWGHETGPYHPTNWTYMGSPYGPHLGQGDNVSDYVLYDPWLTTPWTPVTYVHDIAVTRLVATPAMVQIGETVYINVTVKNFGNATETFTLTTNYDSYAQVETITNLPPGNETMFYYEWDTTSEETCFHTISALANPVSGETYIHNNFRSTGVRIVSSIPQPATIRVEPSSACALVRGTFEVNVTINDLDAYWDLAGFDVKLYYNTTMFDAADVQLGSFAQNFNLTFQLIKEINDAEGYVWMSYMWNFAEIPPEERQTPSGNGVLFTVSFSVVEEGQDYSTFGDVMLAAFPNATKWCTDTSIPIDYLTEEGYVQTLLPMKEDINADGKVDILDVVAAATAYASHPGDPNWNPYADLNGDGVIDILDLVTVTRVYGQIGPCT